MELLEGVPRTLLGAWPTPIRRLESTSAHAGVDVFVKLEAESGAWGSNKVRKLEYVLPRVEGRSVCTHGAGTSSWASALAYHAAPIARSVHVGLAGPIPGDLESLYRTLKTNLHAARHQNLLPFMAARARIAAGRRALALPTGGSGLPGDLGSTWCGIEIAEAISSGAIPKPGEVVVACGSSGTAAGLAAGLGISGVDTKVVAVRVTPRPLGTARLARRHAARVLETIRLQAGARGRAEPVPLIGENRFFGAGYGKPTGASASAVDVARRDGLELDPIYAAKAFAGLLARAQEVREPVLFVHTSPGPPPALASERV